MISKTTLKNASKSSDYVLINCDERLGMSLEFNYSDLVSILENYGEFFASTEDLIDYCVHMEFNIKPKDEWRMGE